jgi:hypothetical protein
MVLVLPADDPLAVAATAAVQTGDLEALGRLLADEPGLATAYIGDHPDGMSRTLLHAATDWPGHFPNNAATVRALIDAGADVNARFTGPHTETPLHWTASTDDVEVMDVLLDSGADIEARGAVIAGGTPLADATAFGQWNAARRLVERGARSNLFESAAMGLLDRVDAELDADPPPEHEHVNGALWAACHGGQLPAAQRLLAAGAEVNWVAPWDGLTPLDAARRSQADGVATWEEVADWLAGQGARTAEER